MGFLFELFLQKLFSSQSKYPQRCYRGRDLGKNMYPGTRLSPKKWLEGSQPTVSSCPKPGSERGTWASGRTFSEIPPSFMRLGGFA